MRNTTNRGFALVTAVFLMVILAALGAFMVTLSGTHQAAPRLSLTGTRVYFGAKTGLDWGIHRAIAVGGVTGCAASTGLTLTGNGLDGVTATVTCTTGGLTHTGGNVYYIRSTAQSGTFGAIDYAQRVMEATVTTVP
jgi:MSHA biogenesis protein MshP